MVAVDEDDAQPTSDSPSSTKIEAVRLDQPVRVRLAAQPVAWGSALGRLGAEQTMTVADLFADCPPDLDNSEANRLAYPRCRLFRADAIRLHDGHRADTSKLVIGGILLAVAADSACIAECGGRASDAALGVLLGSAGVGAIVWFFHGLFKDEGPRN